MDVDVVDGICTKRATEPDDVARLRREAAVLRQLGHPGLVELRSFDDLGEAANLSTVAVSGPPFTSIHGDGVAIGKVAAGLATTLADLHDLGVTHGAVTPDHVLLDDAGRPILCGLGRSMATDPPDPEAAADVADLGRLVSDLLPPAAGADRLAATRTASPRQAQPDRAQALRQLCARATDPLWWNRPPARELAETAWAVVTDAGPGTAGPSRRGHRVAARLPGLRRAIVRRPAAAITVLGAVAVVGGAAAWLAGAGSGPARPSLGPAGPAPVLEHDGARFSVGQSGDVVLAGRFDCTSETAAVVTPSGRIYVFDGWAADGQDLPARHVADVAPGAAVRAADQDGDGCDDLVVDRAGAPPLVVSPREQP